jgi:hypothetical protein
LSITKKLEFLLTIRAFYVTTALATVFSIVINIGQFIGEYVGEASFPISQQNETVGNTTVLVYQYQTVFYVHHSDFYFSTASSYWIVIKYLFRDLGLALALIVVNWLILGQMRESTKRRLKMAGAYKKENAASTTTATVVEGGAAAPAMSATASRSVATAQKAERKRSIMIVLTGVNYVLGHSLTVVRNVYLFFFVGFDQQWVCLGFASELFLLLACCTPIFFYYFFNTHFFNYANTNMKSLVMPVAKLVKLEHLFKDNKKEINTSKCNENTNYTSSDSKSNNL